MGESVIEGVAVGLVDMAVCYVTGNQNLVGALGVAARTGEVGSPSCVATWAVGRGLLFAANVAVLLAKLLTSRAPLSGICRTTTNVVILIIP